MSEKSSSRDQVEQRLKAIEERFRIAQVAGGIGWFEWDLVADAWEWTPHVAVLFGFDPETPRPLFADWQPAIFIDDVPKLRAAVEIASERGPYYVEFRVTHPDGSVHWIAGRGEITKNTAGQASRVAGVYYEISERKALEAQFLALNESLEARVADRARQLAATAAQLAETERRFHLLIDGVTDYAIFMLDTAGNVISWNPGAERIKGYSSAEILGHHFSRFYTEDDRQKGLPRTALATAERTGKYEAEGWRCRKDGTTFMANQRHSRCVRPLVGVRQGHAGHHGKEGGGRTTSSGSKDGGGWTTNRRRCPRLQQSPDRDNGKSGKSRPHSAARPVYPKNYYGGAEGCVTSGDAYASAARVFSPPAAHARSPLGEQARGRDIGTAAADARRVDSNRDSIGGRTLAHFGRR
jgi:PAS domain S-box-containing protein